jgi:hypothetical protein
MTAAASSESTDFFSFISVNYGTGELLLDLSLFGFLVVSVISVVSILRAVGRGRSGSSHEAELLNTVTDLLSGMQVQIKDLKTLLNHEVTKCRLELVHLRQEVKTITEQAPAKSTNAPAGAMQDGSQRTLRELFL